MVKRKCHKCDAEFDKKSHYDRHINRKYDCSRNKKSDNEENTNLDPFQNIPNNSILNPNNSIQNPKYSKMEFENFIGIGSIEGGEKSNLSNLANLANLANLSNLENLPDIDKNPNFLLCGFCCKSYSSKSNLNKHLKVCKVKKDNDDEKEKIFRFLLEKDKEKDKKIDELEKQNKLFEKQNKLLMDKIDKLINMKENTKSGKSNKTSNVSNSNSNNTTNTTNSNNTITNTSNTQNNNIVMVNFGKEDLSIIDEKQFIDRIVKQNKISGVKIPDEVLKIIHFNPQYPQLSNIYISDINREKCMVYEDGEWKLSNVNNIPQIMDKVCIFSKDQIEILRGKHPNNKPLEDRLNTIEKYNNMIDGDYVDDLRDEGRQVEIARCEEFQAHTYNTLKKTMYNEGKKLKKTMKLK